MKNNIKLFSFCIFLSFITACGGGGSSQLNKDDYRLKKTTTTVYDNDGANNALRNTVYKYNNINQLIEQVTNYGSYTDTTKYKYDINNNLVEEDYDGFLTTYFYENNLLVERLISYGNIVEIQYEVIERVNEKATLEKTSFFNSDIGGGLFKIVVRASTYTDDMLTHYEETITFTNPVEDGEFDEGENKTITTDIVVGSSSGNKITVENKVISTHVISNNEDKGTDVTTVKITSIFNEIGLLISKQVLKDSEDYRFGSYFTDTLNKYEYERIEAP